MGVIQIMVLCVGIDPSLNSTGICLSSYDVENDIEEKVKFNIVHCDKLSKREREAEQKYAEFFEYNVFNGISKDKAKTLSSTEFEFAKTVKVLECVKAIKEILNKEFYKNAWYDRAYVCMEALSYGSTRSTKSIFELAGLNYLIRYTVLELFRDSVALMITPPSVIKKFATGVGNADKLSMIESFKLIYPDFELPKLDDVCDAFFMKELAKKEAKNDYFS